MFEKLNTFLPEFINNTKEILKDKEKLDKIRIEKNKEIKRIKLNDLGKEIPSKYIFKTKNKSNEKEIQMVKIEKKNYKNLLIGFINGNF